MGVSYRMTWHYTPCWWNRFIESHVHWHSDFDLCVTSQPPHPPPCFQNRYNKKNNKRIDKNFMVAPCINNIKHFIVQLMHTNDKILRLLKKLKLQKLLQHVSIHVKPSSGSHIQCLAKITYLVPVCRHNTDNINNDTHIVTRYVILAKHWMWLPDDGFTWTETCWSSFYNFN